MILRMTRAERRYVFGLFRTARHALHRPPSFPRIIEVQTVNRCNAACPMCPYPVTTAATPLQHMDDAHFDRLLTQMEGERDFSTLILSFQNEPLVDKHLARRAAEFKSRFPYHNLEMVTNGSLLTPERAAAVYPLFDCVSISVNAADRDAYQQVMTGLDWERTTRNVDHIATHPEWVDKTIVRFVKQRHNQRDANRFKQHWNARGFRVFGFEINSRLGAVPDFDNMTRSKTAAIRMRNAALKVMGRALLPGCPIPSLTFYIRADGNVVLCFNDWTERSILGNVFDTSIRDVFLSDAYVRFRNNTRRSRLPDAVICDNCDLYRDGTWLTV